MATAESSDNPILSPSLIDLRLLSQSELHSLSISSAATSRTSDDFFVPKIDRSIFNESAGSRKQTYSRIRLAPRNKPNPHLPSPSSSLRIPLPLPEPLDQENSKIISLLQDLFGVEPLRHGNHNNDHDPLRVEFKQLALPPTAAAGTLHDVPVDFADGSGQTKSRKRGRPRKNVSVPEENGDAEANAMAMVVAAVEDDQKKGFVVEDVGDPFVEELIGRTQGLVTEAQMLEFMEGLPGEWASQRKKRRFVEAGVLCDLLPTGWKLVLSLQRRAGRASVICRRYISPDGHQFDSYKEVCTHLTSNRSNFDMASASHQHVDHVPTSMETDANASSAYHQKQTSIASPINTYDGNSNSHLAFGFNLGDASKSGIYNFGGQDRNTVSFETVPCGKDQAHVDNNGLGLSAVGNLFDEDLPRAGAQDASEPGGVDFTPNLNVGKDVNDNHVCPNEEAVTNCLHKRSSSDDQICPVDNMLHRSSEGNLCGLTSNRHPSAFQDNMNISAGTFDVLKSVDAGCMEPQLGIISGSHVVAADACTSARVMQGTSEGCVPVPLGGSIFNSFDKQSDDDVDKVKKSCLSEKPKSEVEMFQSGMPKFQ